MIWWHICGVDLAHMHSAQPAVSVATCGPEIHSTFHSDGQFTVPKVYITENACSQTAALLCAECKVNGREIKCCAAQIAAWDVEVIELTGAQSREDL